MFTNIVIVPKYGHDAKSEKLARVAEALCKSFATPTSIFWDMSAQQFADCDEHTLFVVIGGDGTMLSAATKAVRTNSTIIGFNTGKLGFLVEYNTNEMVEMLSQLLLSEQTVAIERSERAMLCVTPMVNGEPGDVHYALNDVVVSNIYSDTLGTYDMNVTTSVNKRYYMGRHMANGIIVSTPTGSTGYALNVGGAILDPSLEVMQISTIAAFTMTSRPVIIPNSSTIDVSVAPNVKNVGLKVDGRLYGPFIEGSTGSLRFEVTTLAEKVTILKKPERNFFDVLTEKLQWNKELI